MIFVTTTLDKALIWYPELRWFNLIDGGDSDGSAMAEVLDYDNDLKKKRTVVVVALKDSKPVGWIWIMHQAVDRAIFASRDPRDTVDYYRRIGIVKKRYLLSWIYVHADRRREGIGSKLYQHAKMISVKRHRPLKVEPWNQTSRSFFKAVRS